MKKSKCASFFAGVGGIDIAFKNAGYETIYANEFNEKAAKTYEYNNKDIIVDTRDINDVDADTIPDFDILLAGFPCQAFSIAGHRQGFNDEKGRGGLLFELIRIIESKEPRVVFLENVKNLVGHDNGNTFRVILECLEKVGYKGKISYAVLNSLNHGDIPQNRERIYIVAFKNDDDYYKFKMPMPIQLTRSIRDVIDFSDQVDERYYYSDKCVFYNELKKNVVKNNTVYQWRRTYVRENKNNVCPTLTANMGTGGHNVPIILTDDNNIRKLTPRECFKIQGFPDSFNLPNDIPNTHLYQQAGNSVVVPVITRIAKNIAKFVE